MMEAAATWFLFFAIIVVGQITNYGEDYLELNGTLQLYLITNLARVIIILFF